MASRTRTLPAPAVKTLAHCEGVDVVELVDLTSLEEVPRPGRGPVTLSGGHDPEGLVPGFDEALRRRARLLNTLVQSPAVLRSYALDRVLITAGEGEVDFLLYAVARPDELDAPAVRLVLRVQVESGAVLGKVVPEGRRPSGRAARRALAQRRTRRPATVPLATTTSEQPAAPATVPTPTAPSPAVSAPESPPEAGSWATRPLVVLGANTRLVVLFSLFLATVVSWQVIQTNRSEIVQDRFNRVVAEREQTRRQAEGSEQVTPTRVRLEGVPVLVGGLAVEPVEEALLATVDAVSACYSRVEGWQTLPAEGTLTVHIDLGLRGRAREVVVVEDTVGSEGVLACASDAFGAFAGPAPQDEASVEVKLVFTSGV